ncbi:LARP7 (predicted), partial [Pycnogonum litorale]
RELVADNLSGDPNSKVNSETAGKKGRKRNQKLLKLVKEQLEFYFSDANLNKDRYLWNLIQESEDGYVDFEIFKDFNKMKALTTDPSMLARSISESSLLQLSDDKRRVCRVTPVAEPVGIDERTIYVECLPSHGNHEWLRGVFGTYGPICYISVPCYQASKKIKGFAFVEFEHAESALRACEHFGAKTDEIKAYVEAISKEESISNKSPHSFHNITAVISDKNLRYNNEESKQVKSGNDAEVDRKSDQAISSDKETDNIAKVDH